MKKLFFITFFIAFNAFALTDGQKAKVLSSEWNTLRSFVDTLEADYVVGGLYNARDYGTLTLLWKISNDAADNEVVRFYVAKPAGQQDFGVTYHRSHHIVPGRLVLRRFFGPDSTGWRNDTIDFETGEYIGSQGTRVPRLDESDAAIMNEWRLTIFND